MVKLLDVNPFLKTLVPNALIRMPIEREQLDEGKFNTCLQIPCRPQALVGKVMLKHIISEAASA